MTEENKPLEEKKPKKKKIGFWRKYFGFFALVAGISSAGKPWEEEEDATEPDQAKKPDSAGNLAKAIHSRFEPMGGLELPEIKREPMRDPPKIGE